MLTSIYGISFLTHWCRVTHICFSKVTIIASDNGLSPDRRQAIMWTNAGLLLIGPLGTNFGEILIEILIFSFKIMRLNVSSTKRRPFCLGLNVLNGPKVVNSSQSHMKILTYRKNFSYNVLNNLSAVHNGKPLTDKIGIFVINHALNLASFERNYQILSFVYLIQYLQLHVMKGTGLSSSLAVACHQLRANADHYNDVIMSTMASQITSLAIVYSSVYTGPSQRKLQSSASLAFVRGIHRWPMNSPHKRPVTRKMFPFDDVIMFQSIWPPKTSFVNRKLAFLIVYVSGWFND